jgi:Protein of unknown function (DUF3800)
VLRSYLDGSEGKPPSAAHRSLTLAGYVADDGTWMELEDGWRNVLHSHVPRAEYMHMREAMFLRGGFSEDKGWTDDAVTSLLRRLLKYLYEADFNDRIYGVCCTINRDDYDRAKREGYQLLTPHTLCAALCSEKILARQYLRAKKEPVRNLIKIEGVDFFLDQGERFLHCLRGLWMERRRRAEMSWGLINQVTAVEMRKNPGVQLADILAWSRNRSIAIGADRGHKDLCDAILGSTDSSEWDLDYQRLTKPHRQILTP